MKSLIPYVTNPELAPLFEAVKTISITALDDDVVELAKIDSREFYIFVESRGEGTWAVKDRFGEVYDREGRMRYEPMPSSRTEAFIKRYRMTLVEAVTLAEKIAPTLTLANWDAAGWNERVRTKEKERLAAEALNDKA